MSCIGLVTFSNSDEATQIIQHLLEKHLIACGNIISGIESHYWEENKIQHDREVLVLLKTNPTKIKEITAEIEKRHAYKQPVIEFINTDHINPTAQQWINQHTK